MDTKTLLENLNATYKKHKDDHCFTGQTNIAAMCADIYPKIKKLLEYEDAEEAGTLFEFPCKVGDHVYCNIHFREPLRAEVTELHIGVFTKGISIYHPTIGILKLSINEIGKCIFLTKEEAEAALKAKQEGE